MKGFKGERQRGRDKWRSRRRKRKLVDAVDPAKVEDKPAETPAPATATTTPPTATTPVSNTTTPAPAPVNATATATAKPKAPVKEKEKDESLEPGKENINCKECSKTIRSHNCTDIYKSDSIFRSKAIKYSKFLNDSMVCDNCKFSNRIFNSTNVSHSNDTRNSSNISFSALILNSTEILNSTNVTNSTNVSFSEEIFHSLNITDSDECTNCVNCKNCTMCSNVTNCVNCFNVTDAINATNATHAIQVSNVTDVYNVKNLTHASNMTNATHCENCHNNYNCTAVKCMVPRVDPSFQQAIDKKVLENTRRLVKRLYDAARIGDIAEYESRPSLLDRHIFRANTLLFDLARYRVIFDADGIDLLYGTGDALEPNPRGVIDGAIEHFTKSASEFEDGGIHNGHIEVDEGYNEDVVEVINENSDFGCVHDFVRDARKGIISFKSIEDRKGVELRAYDQYLKKISKEGKTDYKVCKEGTVDYLYCQLNQKEVAKVEMQEERWIEQEEARDELERAEKGGRAGI